MAFFCIRLLRSKRLCYLLACRNNWQKGYRTCLSKQKKCTLSLSVQGRRADIFRDNNLQPWLQVQTGLAGSEDLGTLCAIRLALCKSIKPRLLSVSAGHQRTLYTCIPSVCSITLQVGLPCCQQFHTSASYRALPVPLVWMIIKPLQKLLAIILGRSIRKWWAGLPQNRQEMLRQALWRKRWHAAAGIAALVAVLALFLLTHLDESPITSRMRLLVFNRDKFIELAELTAEGYMEEFKDTLVSRDDPRHKVVETVVSHLVQRNRDLPEMSALPWTVQVVEDPTVNAFVLPNGRVFIFTGMLEAVADIHQLTFILGHEMAHAIIGHSFMFERPYSRKLEAEADKVGLQLAAKACADVRAGPVFWQQMEILDRLEGEPSMPEWLSTHPSHRNRATQLDRLVPQALELRERCDCPTLPTRDPRTVFRKSMQVLLESVREKADSPSHGGSILETAQSQRQPRAQPLPMPPHPENEQKHPRVFAAKAQFTESLNATQK
ncbi:metalloendopeptidase OMA1, mitochondrial isoform X2 [Lepisosteus oculatus]|uniref:metalloendopeptidase OMA1, mitochondrial isoform X2 n=1 Tax=Lepisosteus oculatus TaxID=7918 RepID=UPI00073FE716|nr:PREDICTED: metalloendopeptidase OMA1, mitochondrial isoform X2 [Lepisosteus oculatus]